MEQALQLQAEIDKVFEGNPVNLVGGSVRDLILGREPKDWDYCTPLSPDEIEAFIRKAKRKPYLIGKRFGTIGFKVPVSYYNGEIEEDGKKYHENVVEYIYIEVTTYRSEVYTAKSRKPEVEFITDLDQDLSRRDFTINAMVLRSDGDTYDPHGGRLDILKKQIKTVGLPKDRIQEDPLRMLRAARFASQLDFDVDPNMIGKMRQKGYTIGIVSKERWVAELDKMLEGKNPVRGISVLMDSELMKYILPEVYMSFEDEEALQAVVKAFEENEMDLNAKWATLLYFIGYPFAMKVKKDKVTFPNHEHIKKELIEGICARLKFSNERRDYLLKNVVHFNV